MLKIKDLSKTYGKVRALSKLNLEIATGEFFGFVGPNGSGKTTTMRIISGLLKADSGTISLDGVDAIKDPNSLKRKIAYMPDFFGVYDNLSAIEYMLFYASTYGMVGQGAKKTCLELMDLVGLKDKEDTYVDSLSRGMKQRLCLARCLIHDPSFLILDEPASGLDPRVRYEMKLILNQIKDRGKTILISSHILPEIAEMCTTIGIIEGGKIIVKGTVDEVLMARRAFAPIEIKIIGDTASAIKVLKQNLLVQNITINANKLTVLFNGNEDKATNLLADLIKNGARVASFARQESNLESLFMDVTKKEDIVDDEWDINGEV